MTITKHWKKITGESKKDAASVTEEIEWLEKKDEWKNLKLSLIHI